MDRLRARRSGSPHPRRRVSSPGALADPGSATGSISELHTNLGGAVRMTRLSLPLLAASAEGGVLFVSSAVALAAVPGFAVYAATKAAVHSLARSLRAELRPTGIRVFEVLPPVVATAMTRHLDVPKIPPSVVGDAVLSALARDRQQIPVGRVRGLIGLARIAPRLADRIVQRALRPAADRAIPR